MKAMFRRQRGAISLMLIVIIMPVLLAFATGHTIARRMNDEASLVRAMRLQLNDSLAHYDLNLYEQFGLLGVAEDQLTTDVFRQLALRRYKATPAELTVAADVLAPEVLSKQIARTMKLRLPVLWLNQLWNLASESNWGDLLAVPGLDKASGDWPDALEQVTEVTRSIPEVSVPEEWTDMLEELIQTSLDQVTEDDKVEVLEKALGWLNDLSGQQDILSALPAGTSWLSQISSWLDGLSAGSTSQVVQQAGLAEYCLAYLTTAVTVRRDGQKEKPIKTIRGLDLSELVKTRPAEVEQILTGKQDADSARKMVRTSLTAIRSVIQLVAILSDADEMAILRVESVALVSILAATTGLVLEPESIAYLLAVGTAIARGLDDVNDLFSGQTIRLLPPGLLDQPFSLSYADHLRLMLLAMPSDKLLQRIGHCIARSFPERHAAALQLNVQIPAGSGYKKREITLELAYAGQ